jgi:hypothetical protein
MQLLVSDGTTTVYLSGESTGISGCTYFPLSPSSQIDTVAEQAELVCRGTAVAIRAALNTLERLAEAAARRRKSGKGTRVYVQYKPVNSDDLYRSELYDGQLVYSEDPGARRLGETSPAIKVSFVFERAPWWEGPEVELSISSQGYAAATGGRRITNNGIDNWVQVTGGFVLGTEPSPLRVRLTNDNGASQDYDQFYIGVNAFASPTTFVGVHQGEADLSGSGSTASATCSNGYYRTFNVTSTEQFLASWLLTAAEMTSGGRWCRLLARLAGYDFTKHVRVRPVITDFYGIITLWEGSQVWLSDYSGIIELNDFGSLPIPPGAYSSEYAQCRFGLKMQADSATTVSIDYVQLVPMDGYRHVTQVGYQTPNGSGTEVNEGDESVYFWTGTQRWPLHVMTGPGLKLWPNVTQRVYVLHDEGAASAIANTLSVRMWHRPRRNVI